MNAMRFLKNIVPEELFDIREDGSLEEQAQHLIDQCHPGATGMQLLEMTSEHSRAEIKYTMSNRALHGYLHGGSYFTVGDTLTAIMCMFYIESESERMLTVQASIRYLRPVLKETVRAEARLTSREGKRLNFICDFFNEANKRAAQAKYTYVLVEPAQS